MVVTFLIWTILRFVPETKYDWITDFIWAVHKDEFKDEPRANHSKTIIAFSKFWIIINIYSIVLIDLNIYLKGCFSFKDNGIFELYRIWRTRNINKWSSFTNNSFASRDLHTDHIIWYWTNDIWRNKIIVFYDPLSVECKIAITIVSSQILSLLSWRLESKENASIIQSEFTCLIHHVIYA